MATLKPGRYQGRDPVTGRKMLDGVTAIVSDRTGEVTYQARWDWTDPAGRRKQKTATKKTLDEAEEAKLKGELQARQGPFVAPEKKTLNQFFDEWHERESLRWAPSTAFNMRDGWDRVFADSIGGMPIRKVTKATCQAEVMRLVALRKPKNPEVPYYKAVTVNYYVTILKAVLNAAVDDELIPVSPARRLTLPRVSEQRKEIWSADTTASFLEATRDSECSLLWWFLATTGARLGEALTLRWADLDLAGATVTFRTTLQRQKDGSWGIKKGTKTTDDPKIIPLIPTMVERFKEAQREARSGSVVDLNPFVFRTEAGDRYTENKIYTRLQRDCRKAGVAPISPHMLRHTTGTLLVSMGVPESMVQVILRHKSIVTTLGTYVHPSYDDLRSALGRLGDALNATTLTSDSDQNAEVV